MPWRIWFELYEDGRKIGAGLWHRRYKYKGNAVRAAKRQFGKERFSEFTGKTRSYKWVVSQTNPWRN